jgi:hypothetical protein
MEQCEASAASPHPSGGELDERGVCIDCGRLNFTPDEEWAELLHTYAESRDSLYWHASESVHHAVARGVGFTARDATEARPAFVTLTIVGAEAEVLEETLQSIAALAHELRRAAR